MEIPVLSYIVRNEETDIKRIFRWNPHYFLAVAGGEKIAKLKLLVISNAIQILFALFYNQN